MVLIPNLIYTGTQINIFSEYIRFRFLKLIVIPDELADNIVFLNKLCVWAGHGQNILGDPLSHDKKKAAKINVNLRDSNAHCSWE